MEAQLLAERLRRAIDAASSLAPAPTGHTIGEFYGARMKVWRDAAERLTAEGSVLGLEKDIRARMEEIKAALSDRSTYASTVSVFRRRLSDELAALDLIRSNLEDIRRGK